MKRALVVSSVAALIVAAGCGSGDDDASDEPAGGVDTVAQPADDTASPDAAEDDASADVADDASSSDDPAAAGAGFATVRFEGETYRYEQVAPGLDDDWYVFCATVGGSLQAVLQQVDDAGNVVDNSEISVILLEPGGPYEQTGDPPEVSISINNERFLSYNEGDPIDAPASGRSGGGTVTLSENGAMDPQTGVFETTSHEVGLQVAC